MENNAVPACAFFTKLHEDANAHITKAAALADAGKTGNAIEEYQEAFELFPDPAIADRIKALREQSLGFKKKYFFGYLFVRIAKLLAILALIVGLGYCFWKYGQADWRPMLFR